MISDGALFMITTPKNSKRYHTLEFFPVDNDTLVEMKLEFKMMGDGKLMVFDYG